MLHFFGLSEENREFILEQMFFLMHSLHMSYETLKTLPVVYREWFYRRMIKSMRVIEKPDQYGLDTDTPISSRFPNS